jgi:enoyl-CoA hydratase
VTDLEDEVLITVESGRLGHITLNRPRAINALTHTMVGRIHRALKRWHADDNIQTVLLDGAGDRGFCAGGDVRALYFDAIEGGGHARMFWADEYRLNATIANYPKPVVALMDGLVMGGGVGLAGHCSHRVVSESSTISMPEVTIGFSPDVGGTYLLAKAPGELGTHFGLTSGRMAAGDALLCGFADVFIAFDRRAALLQALTNTDVDTAVRSVSSQPPASGVATEQVWIDRCYATDSVEEILQRLTAESRFDVTDRLARLSPTALKVTLQALRMARHDTELAQSLRRELRVSVHSLTSHDFIEGIRAQIIDKDRNPQWSPSRLADVAPADVDRFFHPLGEGELNLAEDQLPKG